MPIKTTTANDSINNFSLMQLLHMNLPQHPQALSSTSIMQPCGDGCSSGLNNGSMNINNGCGNVVSGGGCAETCGMSLEAINTLIASALQNPEMKSTAQALLQTMNQMNSLNNNNGTSKENHGQTNVMAPAPIAKMSTGMAQAPPGATTLVQQHQGTPTNLNNLYSNSLVCPGPNSGSGPVISTQLNNLSSNNGFSVGLSSPCYNSMAAPPSSTSPASVTLNMPQPQSQSAQMNNNCFNNPGQMNQGQSTSSGPSPMNFNFMNNNNSSPQLPFDNSTSNTTVSIGSLQQSPCLQPVSVSSNNGHNFQNGNNVQNPNSTQFNMSVGTSNKGNQVQQGPGLNTNIPGNSNGRFRSSSMDSHSFLNTYDQSNNGNVPQAMALNNRNNTNVEPQQQQPNNSPKQRQNKQPSPSLIDTEQQKMQERLRQVSQQQMQQFCLQQQLRCQQQQPQQQVPSAQPAPCTLPPPQQISSSSIISMQSDLQTLQVMHGNNSNGQQQASSPAACTNQAAPQVRLSSRTLIGSKGSTSNSSAPPKPSNQANQGCQNNDDSNSDIKTKRTARSASRASHNPRADNTSNLGESGKKDKAPSSSNSSVRYNYIKVVGGGIKRSISSSPGSSSSSTQESVITSSNGSNTAVPVRPIAPSSSPSKRLRQEAPVSKSSSHHPSTLQDYLDSIVTSRGYTPQKRPASQLGYRQPPTPLQLASFGFAVCSTIKPDGADQLTALLESGLSPNPTNKFGDSPFFMACKRGLYPLVKVFIDNGADVRVADGFGRTPLHYVAWANPPCLESARLLLGSCPDAARLLYVTDAHGKTPLDFVGEHHRSKWVDFLDGVKDDYWPDCSDNTCYFPEDRIGCDSTKSIPDPKEALSVKLAEKVASGKVAPDEAKKLMVQQRTQAVQ